MRTFCLVLILCNVLFLSWSQLLDARVRDLERSPPTVVSLTNASAMNEPRPPVTYGRKPRNWNGRTWMLPFH